MPNSNLPFYLYVYFTQPESALGMSFPHTRKYTPNQTAQCKYSKANMIDKIILFKEQVPAMAIVRHIMRVKATLKIKGSIFFGLDVYN